MRVLPIATDSKATNGIPCWCDRAANTPASNRPKVQKRPRAIRPKRTKRINATNGWNAPDGSRSIIHLRTIDRAAYFLPGGNNLGLWPVPRPDL